MRWQCIFTALAAGAVAALAADVGIVMPPAASVFTATGQAHFRRGEFAAAAKAFEEAAGFNPSNARAWWGLGRVAEVQFQEEKARDLFAKAYRLDPRDPDIVLSYLDGVTDAGARAVLLRNVIALSRTADPGRAERAAALLEIDRRLGGNPAARLASEYTTYRVPLTGFHPAGVAQDGLIVAVRVNGGKPLRLVLDTGARGILIDGRAARNLGLEPVVASQVSGFGEGEGGETQLNLARSLDIGSLRFEDCLIEVSGQGIPGADGILGVGLFEAFRVRVDAHRSVMELAPSGTTKQSPNAIGLRKLLLVRVAVVGREGWFLLDSGAAYSTMARELVSPVMVRSASANLVGVRGAQSGAFRLGPVSFGAAGRTLVDLAPVALDLGPLSAREGVEISGVLGYSALAQRPFTIDLRHGVVNFE